MILSVIFFLLHLSFVQPTAVESNIVCDPLPGTPPVSPFGTPIGIKPGRVVWKYDPSSTFWDGNGTKWGWWDAIDSSRVDRMFEETLLSLADAKSPADAWDSIFRYHNNRVHGLDFGYVKGETIAVKINLNGDYIDYTDNTGNQVSPQFLTSLIRSLLLHGGVPNASYITIFDSSRLMTHYYLYPPTGLLPEFPSLRFVDNLGGLKGVSKSSPAPLDDPASHIFFSNHSVVGWNESLIPLTSYDADYLIVVDDFRGHNAAGITASGKNFFGCVYFPNMYCKWPVQHTIIHTHFCPQPLHPWIYAEKVPMGSYSPLVDLLGHPLLGNKAIIWLVGGLYGGPANIGVDPTGELHPVPPSRFMSDPFQGNWSSSILASLDPIALDSVVFDILRNEPNVPLARMGCVDGYLHEAAKAGNPRSGTVYKPDGLNRLTSLGVHEHWNGDKKYSRNLGTGDGIELVRL